MENIENMEKVEKVGNDWLSVSEVRKQLKFIETHAETMTRDSILPCGLPAGQFCIEFLRHKSQQNRKHIEQHYKRKGKSREVIPSKKRKR